MLTLGTNTATQADSPAFLVKDITPTGAPPTQLFVGREAQGILYFTVDPAIGEPESWRSDGTEQGTRRVDFGPTITKPTAVYEVDQHLLIFAQGTTSDTALYSGNTDAGPFTLLKDNMVVALTPSTSFKLGIIGAQFLFLVRNATNGTELWRTDGTLAGTVLVKIINPTGNAFASYGTNIGNTLYFVADDGINGLELWKTDGTTEGTSLFKVITPPTKSGPGYLTNVNDTLYFAADDGVNGMELWISDGTADGTHLVKDITPGPDSSFTFSSTNTFTAANGKLLFTITQGLSSFKPLWSSDGTEEGTIQLTTLGSFATKPLSIGGLSIFVNNDAATGVELWRSDGTVAGTHIISDTVPGFVGQEPYNLKVIDSSVFYSGGGLGLSHEVWRTDGTPEGTELVADVNPGYNSSDPNNFTAAGDFIFFTADDGVHGRELWALPRAQFRQHYSYLPLVQAP